MMVRPIRTDEDYQSALKRAAMLFGHDRPKDRDELEVLQAVIERWERSQHSIDAATPAQAIRLRMTQARLSQRDLIHYLGSKCEYPRFLADGDNPPLIRFGPCTSI